MAVKMMETPAHLLQTRRSQQMGMMVHVRAAAAVKMEAQGAKIEAQGVKMEPQGVKIEAQGVKTETQEATIAAQGSKKTTGWKESGYIVCQTLVKLTPTTPATQSP